MVWLPALWERISWCHSLPVAIAARCSHWAHATLQRWHVKLADVLVQNTHKKRLLSKTSLGHVTSALTSLTTSSRPEADVHQDVLAGCTGNWLSHLDWGNER